MFSISTYKQIIFSFVFISAQAVAFQTETYNPLGYFISANTENSTIKVSIIIKQIEQTLFDAIKNGKDTKDKIILHDLHFVFKNDSTKFDLYLDADFNSNGQRAHCKINVNFSIPKSQLPNIIVREAGSNVSCHSGALIPIIPRLIEKIAQTQINDAIKKSILGSANPSKEWQTWVNEDPNWAIFMKSVYVQGKYCKTKNYESLCLFVAWKERDAMSKRYQELQQNAPQKTVSSDPELTKLNRNKLQNFANNHLLKNSLKIPNLKFPAGCRNKDILFCDPSNPTVWDDGDMGIFGGLLCSSGETKGCDLLANAQGANGQFWRSPDKVGEAIKHDDSAAFSGDQFKGVVAYFLATDNKEKFEKFLKFILSKKVNYAVDHGYKSCDNTEDHEDTCLLAGEEWYWLNFLAKKYGVIDLIPEDHRNPEIRFGYSNEVNKLQAIVAPIGYRVHLVAVELFLSKLAGINNQTNTETASLLAGRQNQNPFFLYLHLGNDMLVQKQLIDKCRTEPRDTDYDDWTWQSAEMLGIWKTRSMVWDCVFMYNLMSSL